MKKAYVRVTMGRFNTIVATPKELEYNLWIRLLSRECNKH
jgi:hypothetical protein